MEQYRSLFLGLKKKNTESANVQEVSCVAVGYCNRLMHRLLCQLAQKANGSLHQIVMGQGPSRPTGSQGFQFQPSQHFLANNVCNTCRTIQLWAAKFGFTQTRCSLHCAPKDLPKGMHFQLQSCLCHWIFPDSFSISCMSESDERFCSVLFLNFINKTNLENIIDLLRFVQ